MSTKKAPAKVVAPKKEKAPAKVVAPKKLKGTAQAPAARLTSFTMGAVIPTQSFGNVSAQMTIEALTYEDAVNFAVPKITELYKHFADVKPAFLGKITETEKVVPVAPLQKATSERIAENGNLAAAELNTPVASAPTPTEPATTHVERSEPFKKAERAITLAASHDALAMIENQINNSVKISPNDKPELLAMLVTRRNELPF